MRNILSSTVLATLMASTTAIADKGDMSLAETDPLIGKFSQIEGEWVTSNCGLTTTKAASDHLMQDGDEITLEIEENMANRVTVDHDRWEMIEMPTLRMVDGKIEAADGIALIDGHQHRVTFRPAESLACPGAPKGKRILAIEYSDIDYSHGDQTKHFGISHTHDGG